MKYHKKTNILDEPGNQDLTSLVNFKNLIEIANKFNLNVYGPFSQSNFLLKNGIKQRKEKILLKADKHQRHIINSGYDRLISKDKMGEVFKCFIVSNLKIYNEFK